MAATIIDHPKPAAASAASAKETRVGSAPTPPANAAAAGAGAKETRIGTAPAAPGQRPPQHQQQQGFMPAPPHAQKKPSGSKKWIYVGGAGIAAVLVLGVVVVGVAVFALSGTKKGNEPLKPAALAEEPAKPAPQPTEQTQPSTPADAAAGQPAGTAPATGGTTDMTVTPNPKGTALAPIESPAGGGTVTTSGSSSQGASRPAQQKPVQSKPKQTDSADAARRKREAALRALDQ
jgi:hypothetical protein